jgi:hypothetical protein
MYKIVFVCAALLVGLLGQQAVSSPAQSTTLDYEVFKTKIEPIFLNKRPGHARCVSCHASNNVALHLVPLSPGATTWNEEESRKNFELVQRVAIPGDLQSPILIHPLAQDAGGDFFHSGGKHFNSQNDPEWLTIKAWILGQTASTSR